MLRFKSLFFIVACVLFALMQTACVFKKDVVYFQDIKQGNTNIEYLMPKIQVNDILSIKVSALVPETVAVFNSITNSFDNASSGTVMMNQEMLKLNGYLVSADGTITFPVLGRITVTGMTTRDIEEYLYKRLEQEGYVKNPVITARILNAKFSVLGEVRVPGTYTYLEQTLTLPQALGLAGDLSINGERKEVLIIRDEGGKRVSQKIDLTKTDWFNSPYYFIKQNDVIIVNPNGAKAASAGYLGNISNVLSVVATFLTLYLLIR